MTDRTCRICGESFLVGSRHSRVYCSIPCRRLAERTPVKLSPLTCSECGCQFSTPVTRGRIRRTCSDDCRKAWDNRTWRAKSKAKTPYVPVAHPERSCARCGATYVGRSPRWCSTTCKDSDKKDRRRAAVKAARTERFSRIAVFDRDGWCCGICGKGINRNLVWPHPKSVSLDHVIPLSRGGDHSMANTQAAHLDCNTRKSAGSLRPEQLRLIG